MKMQSGYLLREVAGNYVLMPVGQNVADLRRIIRLNEVSAFICRQLMESISMEELLERMYQEYEAEGEEREIIKSDVEEFIKAAIEKGIMEE